MAEMELSGVRWTVSVVGSIITVGARLNDAGSSWVVVPEEGRLLAFAILNAADQADKKWKQQ